MRELPILMSGPMVTAIFEGKKTETRRPTPGEVAYVPEDPYPWYMRRPDMVWDSFKDVETMIKMRSRYQVGDQLYVRETWRINNHKGEVVVGLNALHGQPLYRADGHKLPYGFYWRPSIHMPKKLARLWLEVTAVKVQPVTAVTYEEALAEGFPDVDRLRADENFRYGFPVYAYALANFRYWWQEQYGADAWSGKRWVFVYQFKVVERG